MQVSDEIIEVLEYLGEKLGVTFDATKENIMPYAQQLAEKYIKWEISTSIVWLCIGVIFLVIGIWLLAYGIKEDAEVLVLAVPILSLSLIIMLVQIFDIIQCNVFPEKQIYEYITHLLPNR